MAKRASRKVEKVLPSKAEAFAEDLGRLLGTAQAKARYWLGQRQEIVKRLTAGTRHRVQPPHRAWSSSTARGSPWTPGEGRTCVRSGTAEQTQAAEAIGRSPQGD